MKITYYIVAWNLLIGVSLGAMEPHFKEEAVVPHVPFYFLRHGMTEWNVLGKQQGQTDIPLNDAGREQVKQLSILCNVLPITHFYCSTLSRARETMEILNSLRKLKLPEYLYDDLKEQGKGHLEGITEQQWKALPRYEIDAAMENKNLFEQRTIRVLRQILSNAIVPCIIAHSNNLRCIGRLTGCTIQDIPYDVIWHFEPSGKSSNPWKMTELKLSHENLLKKDSSKAEIK